MQCATEFVGVLVFTSAELPRPYLSPAMVVRVAEMLNYFLRHLVGPDRSRLRISDSAKVPHLRSTSTALTSTASGRGAALIRSIAYSLKGDGGVAGPLCDTGFEIQQAPELWLALVTVINLSDIKRRIHTGRARVRQRLRSRILRCITHSSQSRFEKVAAAKGRKNDVYNLCVGQLPPERAAVQHLAHLFASPCGRHERELRSCGGIGRAQLPRRAL